MTLPRGPNDSSGHTNTPDDYYEQQVAWVRLSHSPLPLKVGQQQASSPWDPYGEGGVSGEPPAPPTAERACFHDSKAYHSRQHAGDITEVHPC